MIEDIKNRAMHKVTTMYNWDIIADQTYNVYKEILEENKYNHWENTLLKEGLSEINDKKIVTAIEGKKKAETKEVKVTTKSRKVSKKLQKIS